ncbi:MAG: LysR family transcriptional regulator [Rhodobacteraceae bacterium]|nr:LysR family transcriptional regulator [Paracoccaceae bacterium]
MEIQQLKRFLVAAETNNLHAAAARLNITQPALSQSIKKLEESLGEPLFLRGARGVELTEAGRILIPRAQLILKCRDHYAQDLDELRTKRESRLRVGVAPYFSRSHFADAAARFMSAMPGVGLDVIEDQALHLVKQVQVGELDLAFCGANSAIEASDTLNVMPLSPARYALFARAAHPVFQQRRIDLESLSEYPWAVHDRETNGKHFERIFRSHGVEPPEFSVSTRSLPVIVSMVCKTDCIALLAEDSVRAERELGLIKSIHVPQIEIETLGAIYTLADAPQSKALKSLIAELCAVAAIREPKLRLVESGSA